MPKPIERWASEVDDTEHPTREACEAHEAMVRDISAHIAAEYDERYRDRMVRLFVTWCRTRGVDPARLKLRQPTLALGPASDDTDTASD